MSPVKGTPLRRMTCPKCGAEILTQKGSQRQQATYRLRHHDDGRHTMEKAS